MWPVSTEYNGVKGRSLRSNAKKMSLNNPPMNLPNKLHLTFPSALLLPCMSPGGPATPCRQDTQGLAASTPGRTQGEQRKIANMLALLLHPLLF